MHAEAENLSDDRTHAVLVDGRARTTRRGDPVVAVLIGLTSRALQKRAFRRGPRCHRSRRHVADRPLAGGTGSRRRCPDATAGGGCHQCWTSPSGTAEAQPQVLLASGASAWTSSIASWSWSRKPNAPPDEAAACPHPTRERLVEQPAVGNARVLRAVVRRLDVDHPERGFQRRHTASSAGRPSPPAAPAEQCGHPRGRVPPDVNTISRSSPSSTNVICITRHGSRPRGPTAGPPHARGVRDAAVASEELRSPVTGDSGRRHRGRPLRRSRRLRISCEQGAGRGRWVGHDVRGRVRPQVTEDALDVPVADIRRDRPEMLRIFSDHFTGGRSHRRSRIASRCRPRRARRCCSRSHGDWCRPRRRGAAASATTRRRHPRRAGRASPLGR